MVLFVTLYSAPVKCWTLYGFNFDEISSTDVCWGWNYLISNNVSMLTRLGEQRSWCNTATQVFPKPINTEQVGKNRESPGELPGDIPGSWGSFTVMDKSSLRFLGAWCRVTAERFGGVSWNRPTSVFVSHSAAGLKAAHERADDAQLYLQTQLSKWDWTLGKNTQLYIWHKER